MIAVNELSDFMKDIEIFKYEKGQVEKKNDVVAEEKILRVKIMDNFTFDAIVTPSNINHFVYGYLHSEGFIKHIDDVLDYHEEEMGEVIYVSVKIKSSDNQKIISRSNYNILWTECGNAPELRRVGDVYKKYDDKFTIKASDLFKIHEQIKDKTELYKQTGAYHYAFLFDKKMELIHLAHDIGRHNAVDKVIGMELLKGHQLEDKILYITGRIASDVVQKCLRARIPLLITRGAPLNTAINIAKKYELGLIGFFRGKRFNVYSNESIIEF
jgi:FdhD protein